MTKKQIIQIEEQEYFEQIEKELAEEKAREIYFETINEENQEDLCD